jgi:hypothetical protein
LNQQFERASEIQQSETSSAASATKSEQLRNVRVNAPENGRLAVFACFSKVSGNA